MDFPTLADWQIALITTISGGIMGITTSLVVKWYERRKPTRVSDTEYAKQIADAASDTVTVSQKVIDLLDARLTREREYYDKVIERLNHDFNDQLAEMKTEHDSTISDLQSRITKGEKEKENLSKQVAQLTLEKEGLQREVTDLQERLKNYDGLNNSTGAK